MRIGYVLGVLIFLCGMILESVLNQPASSSAPVPASSQPASGGPGGWAGGPGVTYYDLMMWNRDVKLCRIIAQFEGYLDKPMAPCGPLAISRACFADVCLPGETYSLVTDFEFSVRVMQRYWARYKCVSYEDKCRVHRSGPSGRWNAAADARWKAVSKCLQ